MTIRPALATWLLPLFGAAVALACPFVVAPGGGWLPYVAIAVAMLLASAYQASKITRLHFRDGRFTCARGASLLREEVTHVASDIDGFVARGEYAAPEDGEGVGAPRTVVTLVTRTGAYVPLPVDLDGVVGMAPADHARFVVDRLNEAFEDARHGTTHYRLSALEARVEASEDASPIDGSEARRRA